MTKLIEDLKHALRVFRSQVFAVTAVGAIGLGTVAVVARRAGRVDPLEALRHD